MRCLVHNISSEITKWTQFSSQSNRENNIMIDGWLYLLDGGLSDVSVLCRVIAGWQIQITISGAPPIWIWQIHPDQLRRPHLFQMTLIWSQQICILHQPFCLVSIQFQLLNFFSCVMENDIGDDEKGGDEHWHRSHEGQIWSRGSCRLP